MSIITQTALTTTETIEYDELFNKIDKLGISGRNFELFLPLMLIAEEIGVLSDILQVCSNMASRKKEDEYNESKDVSLFEFVVNISYEGLNYLFIKELTGRFRKFLGEEDSEDRWLNEKWMGRALKRLNLVLDTRKMSQGRQVVLNYSKAAEKIKIFKQSGKRE